MAPLIHLRCPPGLLPGRHPPHSHCPNPQGPQPVPLPVLRRRGDEKPPHAHLSPTPRKTTPFLFLRHHTRKHENTHPLIFLQLLLSSPLAPLLLIFYYHHYYYYRYCYYYHHYCYYIPLLYYLFFLISHFFLNDYILYFPKGENRVPTRYPNSTTHDYN